MNEDDRKVINDSYRELKSWRKNFIKEVFSKHLKNIPKDYRVRLEMHFLSIPSDCFTDPWQEWNKCISCLLQYLAKKSK